MTYAWEHPDLLSLFYEATGRRMTYSDITRLCREALHSMENRSPDDRASDVSPEIITALNNGDDKAFEYIYLHYYDSLANFLCALLKRREEAREIAQDVFASLWFKRGIFDPTQGIKRYLYQLAKFHAFNYLDKAKVREKYEMFQSRAGAQEMSADERVQSEETATLIELIICRMPPRQQQVFRMNREQNMTYDQIAEQLGISRNRVRNYISDSLKELRRVLVALVALLLG